MKRDNQVSFLDSNEYGMWVGIIKRIAKSKILNKKERDVLQVVDNLVDYDYGLNSYEWFEAQVNRFE